MCWRLSKLCIIAPGATGLRAVENILPIWKEHEHDNKCSEISELSGIKERLSGITRKWKSRKFTGRET